MYKSGTGDEYKTGANANLHDPISALLSSPPSPPLGLFHSLENFYGCNTDEYPGERCKVLQSAHTTQDFSLKFENRTGEEANWRLSQNLRLKMFKKMTQCIFVVELFDLFWNRRQKRRERGWNLTLSQKLRCRWPVIVSESTTIYTFSTEADQWGPIHHKLGSRNKLRSRLIIKFAGDTQRHSSHSESNMQIQRCQKSLQLSCESIKT